MEAHHISPQLRWSITDVCAIVRNKKQLALSEEAVRRITICRAYLDEVMTSGNEAVYGINTGFGALCNTVIEKDQLELLQRNLLLSHACGMGEVVPDEIVRTMLLLKIHALSIGHSGVQLETVQRLINFFNLGITPVIYQQGSLGASGDLAPLAHLALPLIGEGEVMFEGQKMHASAALKKAGLKPIALKSKEGLALINGTQFIGAYACNILNDASEIITKGNQVAALSVDAFDARPEPFESLTHNVRPHNGQRQTAKRISELLAGSEIQKQHKAHVQDPYSFRCIPQVHGASADAIHYCFTVVETEINSVTDNPIIFPDEKRIISGGNFHAQPLALALDFLAIALSELGSISERRIYKLISGQRNLPPFLAKDAGLNSGFMIPQYTAASIVSQNKQLCTPASVDTIDSSQGQEDHVSMGANAATKCARVCENVKNILSIELLTAAQALDFRRPLCSSAAIETLHSNFRKEIPFVEADVYLHEWMKKSHEFLFG